MSAEKPDYHDAKLMLRVYDMRRESRTREARDKLNFGFWPKSFDDVKAVQQTDHELNFAWRQLSGYWELVYGLARHGIVNADYLCESNGEGMFFYAKVRQYLSQIRETAAPTAFQNLEWAATNCETGRKMIERFEKQVQTIIESK
jgi:hypothetical protein